MVENLFLEVIRAFYSYCHDVLGSDLKLSYTQSGNPLVRYELSLHIPQPPPPMVLLLCSSVRVMQGERVGKPRVRAPWQLFPSNREDSEVIWQRPLDLLYTSGEAQGEGKLDGGMEGDGREGAQKWGEETKARRRRMVKMLEGVSLGAIRQIEPLAQGLPWLHSKSEASLGP